MRDRVECRCQFCLDRTPLIVKADLRSGVRPDDAAECKHCRAYRVEILEMPIDRFMRLVLKPPEGTPSSDHFWLIHCRRLTNERAYAGIKIKRYLAPRKEAAE